MCRTDASAGVRCSFILFLFFQFDFLANKYLVIIVGCQSDGLIIIIEYNEWILDIPG